MRTERSDHVIRAHVERRNAIGLAIEFTERDHLGLLEGPLRPQEGVRIKEVEIDDDDVGTLCPWSDYRRLRRNNDLTVNRLQDRLQQSLEFRFAAYSQDQCLRPH